MTRRSNAHDEIVNEFVKKTVRRVIVENHGELEDLMVVTESIITGLLMVMHKHYAVSPQQSVVYLEEMLNSATKRFAEQIEMPRRK